LTKADQVPRAALEETIRYIQLSTEDRAIPVIPIEAVHGKFGVEELKTEILKAGAYVNRRRKRQGVNPRAVRTIMVGLPNVGKSSVINRLAGRMIATRAGSPGATKKMTWHKIGGFRNTELEFLDTPGLIPMGFAKRYTKEQQNLLCITYTFTEKVTHRTQNFFDFVFRVGKLAREHPHLMEARTLWEETSRKYRVDWQSALRYEGPIFPPNVKLGETDSYSGGVLAAYNRGELGKIQLEPPPAEPRSAQEWDSLLKGSTAKRKHMDEVKIRGAIGPGEERVNLPVKLDEAEKVPVWIRSRNSNSEGMFEGW